MIKLKQYAIHFYWNKDLCAFVWSQLLLCSVCVHADTFTDANENPENILAFSGSSASMNQPSRKQISQDSRKSNNEAGKRTISKRSLGKSLIPFQIDYQAPEQLRVGNEFSVTVKINTPLDEGTLTVRPVTEDGLELIHPETALVFDLAALKSQTKSASVEIKLLAKAVGRHYINLFVSSSASSLNTEKPFSKVTSLAITVLGESSDEVMSETMDRRKAQQHSNGVFTDATGERIIRINPRK